MFALHMLVQLLPLLMVAFEQIKDAGLYLSCFFLLLLPVEGTIDKDR